MHAWRFLSQTRFASLRRYCWRHVTGHKHGKLTEQPTGTEHVDMGAPLIIAAPDTSNLGMCERPLVETHDRAQVPIQESLTPNLVRLVRAYPQHPLTLQCLDEGKTGNQFV